MRPVHKTPCFYCGRIVAGALLQTPRHKAHCRPRSPQKRMTSPTFCKTNSGARTKGGHRCIKRNRYFAQMSQLPSVDRVDRKAKIITPCKAKIVMLRKGKNAMLRKRKHQNSRRVRLLPRRRFARMMLSPVLLCCGKSRAFGVHLPQHFGVADPPILAGGVMAGQFP